MFSRPCPLSLLPSVPPSCPSVRLFEIRGHPHGLQRHHHQQSLSCLHNLSLFHLLVRRNAIHRLRDLRVAQVQLRRFHRRRRLFHFVEFRLRTRGFLASLFDVHARLAYT